MINSLGPNKFSPVWSNYGHNSRWLIAKEPNYFGSSFKDANLSLLQSSLNINGARAG